LLSVALPISVYLLTGSVTATSGIVAANVGAALVVGPLAGVFADRWDRRRVMIVANVAQAAVVLPLLFVDSPSRVWIVYLVAVAESVLGQFVAPAEHALLPRLVPEADLAAANSMNTLNSNIARLAGPALGGIVAATLGLGGAAVLDAVTFAVAAGLIAAISGVHRATDRPSTAGPAGARSSRPPGRSGPRHLAAELVDGLRVVRRSAVLRAVFAVVLVTSIGEGLMGSLFAVFVNRALGGGAREIGWLMSAQAVGGIVGGLLSAGLGPRIRPIPMLTAGLVAFGAVDLVIFNLPRWSTGLMSEVLLFVLVGLPGALLMAAAMTLLQTEVDDGWRGRVFAAILVTESAARLVGASLAGTVTDHLGVINVLTGQGLAYVLAGLAFGLKMRRSMRGDNVADDVRRWRQLELPAEAVARTEVSQPHLLTI
jgi:predicted MFS family arabinose efflux permease